jgi:hypothetical protein
MISTDRKSDLVESLYFSTLVIYPRVDMSGAEFTEYRRQILGPILRILIGYI